MSVSKPRGLLMAAASVIAMLGALAPLHAATAEPAPVFRELYAQVQTQAPRLAEAAANLRQAQGLARQAAARPNPTASVDVENFSGKGPYSGTDLAETTFMVGQAIELGGKRAARIDAGRASVDAARARLTQARADYGADLALAYADAEAAEKRVNLAQEGLTLAQEDLRAARALVEAGREAELRGIQAEAAMTSAQAFLNAAQVDRTRAFARLTALSGSTAPFTALSESLLTRTPSAAPTDVDALSVPSVVAASAERDAAARRVRVEKTRAVPDVTASVGWRRFNGDDTSALVAGVSVPIPIFDQNRGNIDASRAELTAAEARLSAARLDAEAELRTALFQVGAAQSRQTAAQQSEAAADEAYRLTRIAYESGKASLIELVTARRGLAESRNQTLDAQLARLGAEAGLARLQGRVPFGAN